MVSPAAFDILLRRPFTRQDFDAFLTERKRAIQDSIESLLVKSRLELPPQLREIDAQIEDVELRLRRLIRTALQDDPTVLPGHVQEKISGRVQAILKTNPGADMADYRTLAAQLEFTDLTELQATILSKVLWPRFMDRFRSKENTTLRFTQLGGLRNSIRHSRQVTEIVLTDGKAAILWFEQAVK